MVDDGKFVGEDGVLPGEKRIPGLSMRRGFNLCGGDSGKDNDGADRETEVPAPLSFRGNQILAKAV